MMTRDDEMIEEIANQQLKATREVLYELRDLAGVDELPGGYYWFRGTDYISMDKYGNLEAWSSGRRGQPDERSGFDFKLDESVITWKEGERYEDGSQDDRIYEHDIEAFKAKLRVMLLPEFNKLRAAKRANLEATILSSQAKLATCKERSSEQATVPRHRRPVEAGPRRPDQGDPRRQDRLQGRSTRWRLRLFGPTQP